MKPWAKGGLIGFIVAFVGLWIILILIGSDSSGWRCVTVVGSEYCSFFSYVTSIVNWGFVLFFSWVGFFAGVIDSRIIRKILKKKGNEKLLPLKVTLVIMVTMIVVFAIIGILAFDDWITVMLYSLIFFLFTLFVSWAIGRIKYH